jgi:hypothetical protein
MDSLAKTEMTLLMLEMVITRSLVLVKMMTLLMLEMVITRALVLVKMMTKHNIVNNQII